MATQGRGIRQVQRNSAYVQGSTVRKLKEVPVIKEQPKKRISHATRKNRERALHMNIGYVLFLSAAMIMAGCILTGYLTLQSDITNSIKSISRLESQLNDLRLSNDEDYSRITSSVNLEEVKRIAIQELGMKYAEKGQIVTFNGDESDYVRQNGDVPEN